MKYLNLLILFAIVNLTWWLASRPSDLSTEQHEKLQAVIQEYLGAYLKESNPKASEVLQPQVITRVIEAGRKMQTQFKFSFYEEDENGSRQKVTREGMFLLTSEDGNDWTAKMERISDSHLEFDDPMAILRAKPGELDAEPTSTPKEEPHGH
ncbi:MAG: hypothetical protein K2Q26_14290 [Bdellovibrionales bacterium]|nr:hypothetical protein [Bdellovibrionales bacterium]